MHRVTVANELSDSQPALIVVAFGTNEGFDESLDLRDYGQSFARYVGALARMAPQAAILVLGPPDGSKPNARAGWCAPPHLAAVRRLQQALAAGHGWPFWDWRQAMGGAGIMNRLAAQDPPLAFADRMHLNRTGYSATAEVLYHDLIGAYEAWKSQQ
jgi:lysophospholipase L1-like esterase